MTMKKKHLLRRLAYHYDEKKFATNIRFFRQNDNVTRKKAAKLYPRYADKS